MVVHQTNIEITSLLPVTRHEGTNLYTNQLLDDGPAFSLSLTSPCGASPTKWLTTLRFTRTKGNHRKAWLLQTTLTVQWHYGSKTSHFLSLTLENGRVSISTGQMESLFQPSQVNELTTNKHRKMWIPSWSHHWNPTNRDQTQHLTLRFFLQISLRMSRVMIIFIQEFVYWYHHISSKSKQLSASLPAFQRIFTCAVSSS